jgi:hypothetical protein
MPARTSSAPVSHGETAASSNGLDADYFRRGLFVIAECSPSIVSSPSLRHSWPSRTEPRHEVDLRKDHLHTGVLNLYAAIRRLQRIRRLPNGYTPQQLATGEQINSPTSNFGKGRRCTRVRMRSPFDYCRDNRCRWCFATSSQSKRCRLGSPRKSRCRTTL